MLATLDREAIRGVYAQHKTEIKALLRKNPDAQDYFLLPIISDLLMEKGIHLLGEDLMNLLSLAIFLENNPTRRKTE